MSSLKEYRDVGYLVPVITGNMVSPPTAPLRIQKLHTHSITQHTADSRHQTADHTAQEYKNKHVRIFFFFVRSVRCALCALYHTTAAAAERGGGWRVSYIHTNVMPPCSCGVVERAALVTNAKSKRTTLDPEPPGSNCYTRNPRGSGNYR